MKRLDDSQSSDAPSSGTGNLRTVSYVRVSRERTGMVSPEIQRHEIDRAEAATPGARRVEHIEDIDVSGTSFNRPGFKQVIQLAEQRAFDVLIVWKYSRFGRNLVESLQMLIKLEALGVKVISATEPIGDTSTAMGEFSLTQMLAIAQLDSRMKSEGWKEAQARRVRLGRPPNANQRFGYRRLEDGAFVPDPGQAPILKQLYQRYVDGWSAIKLCQDLNARRITRRRGGDWTTTRLIQVLESGFGAGLLILDTKPPKDSQGQRIKGPDGKNIKATPRYVAGTHDPVISAVTWEAFLRRRSQVSAAHPRMREGKLAVTGLLKCGTCGRSMVRYSVNYKLADGTPVRKLAFRCPSSRNGGASCSNSVFNSTVQELLTSWIKNGAGFGAGEFDPLIEHIAGRQDDLPVRPITMQYWRG